MFERSKVDNSQQLTGIPVELVRDDGSLVKGKILGAVSARLIDLLNAASQFLEFETYDGKRSIIAKGSLRDVRPTSSTAGTNQLIRHKENEFDPYRILEIEPGANWEQIKQAFHARSKVYHPDRYASAELPAEVRDYLASMARRINAAYAALEPIARTRQPVRAEPVYTTANR